MRRLLLMSALLAACGAQASPQQGRARGGNSEVGGDVLSTVDGHPITTDEVTALMHVAPMNAADALRRLQGEVLLGMEAERRGFTVDARVAWETRRALAQALLAEFEARGAEVGDEEVVARFESRREDLGQPERRRAAHVLVLVDADADAAVDEAARREAETIRNEMEVVSDLSRWADREGCSAEELPPFPLQGPLEVPFAQALFEVDAPAVLSRVVRSSYGWHAIIVREVLPEHRPEFSEVAEELRAELAAERHFEALGALVARLEAEIGVDRREGAIERAMRMGLER